MSRAMRILTRSLFASSATTITYFLCQTTTVRALRRTLSETLLFPQSRLARLIAITFANSLLTRWPTKPLSAGHKPTSLEGFGCEPLGGRYGCNDTWFQSSIIGTGRHVPNVC